MQLPAIYLTLSNFFLLMMSLKIKVTFKTMTIPAIIIIGPLNVKPPSLSETVCAKRLSGKLIKETKRATDMIRNILFIKVDLV